MVFSSITFLLCFLPVTLIAYYLAGNRLRNLVLLLTSLLFYAWGEGGYVLIMLLSIALNFVVGRLLDRTEGKQARTAVLAGGIGLNLALLGYFKYGNWLAEIVAALIPVLKAPDILAYPIHLPIGISFFTFQALSYIIDVYRKDTESQKNPLHLGLYIASFPQLIAGPIVRYSQVAAQIQHRLHDSTTFASGVERFIFGLSKKVLIANPLSAMADLIFSQQYAHLPVLSVTAPFKAGYASATDYTDVKAGTMTVAAAADLYLYDNNTIHAVKVTGAQIKLWLENAAHRFNRIDPTSTADQWLINDSKTGVQPGSAFPGYNYDVFTSPDIGYEIDVTQPTYNVNNPGQGGERIKNLTYQGQPMDPAQEFIVATNNYRANSSARYILGTGKSFDIIWAAPDANREVVLNYVKAKQHITRAANGATSSWRFARVATAGKVLFKSGKDELGVAQAAGLANVSVDRADDTGVNNGTGTYTVYRIDLGQ